MYDHERINDNDKVLVCIPNLYMLKQILWYHEKYPEGSWDALVISFGSQEMLKATVDAVKRSNLFKNIYINPTIPYEEPLFKKMALFMGMGKSFLLLRKKQFAKKTICKITGSFEYKKAIILSTFSVYAGLIVNAMAEGEVICLEDGLADYFEYKKWPSNPRQLLAFALARMGFCNITVHGMRPFTFRPSRKCIKYNSLPDKLRYRNYFEIKQLFEGAQQKKSAQDILYSCDIIVFATCLGDFTKDIDTYYDDLYAWLRLHYSGKKILIKNHPREKYVYNWDNLDIALAPDNISGEDLLDKLDCSQILLMYTSTLLFKLCREKLPYKVIHFNHISSDAYHSTFEKCRELLEIDCDRIIDI